jgi:hypothetical protein
MDDIDDHNLPPDYMPGGLDDTGGRLIKVMRIHGKGTLPGLLDVIRNQLMAGNGIVFATDDYAVVNKICAVADRVGGIVEINMGTGWELEGIQVLPPPEPSQARH